MFRKKIKAHSRQLGGKDAKKFKTDILMKHYPWLTDDDKELLFPQKSSLFETKLSNRAVAYGTEEAPLFFDVNGHNDLLLPTIYALAIVPNIIPTLYTSSDVSSKLLGGADLFLPGVLVPSDGLEPFLAGTPRSVSVPGNPIPFAVGRMAVSSAEAEREGMKGRGLNVIHTYGDLLYGLGPGVGRHVPNDGFTPDKIHAIQKFTEDRNDEEISAEDENNYNGTLSSHVGNDQYVSVATQECHETSKHANLLDEDSSAVDSKNNATTSFLPAVDVDFIIESAVLGGLKSVLNKSLPLNSSDFYQKHVQPLKAAGYNFDFKLSKSYSRLIDVLDKFDKEKVVVLKKIRRQGHICSIHRDHPLLVNWIPIPNSLNSDNDSKLEKNTIQIERVYRAPSTLRVIFGPEGLQNKDRLYSFDEISCALSSYSTHNNLLFSPDINDDKDSLSKTKIDHLFASTLWGKNQGPEVGSFMDTTQLRGRLVEKLQLFYRITRHPSGISVTRRGPLRRVVVIGERRFGHPVTAVSHVESFGFVAEEVVGDFRRRFKTAGSVSKLPGKTETDHEILLQGDLVDKVITYFTKTEGVDDAYLEVTNKLKKKK